MCECICVRMSVCVSLCVYVSVSVCYDKSGQLPCQGIAVEIIKQLEEFASLLLLYRSTD